MIFSLLVLGILAVLAIVSIVIAHLLKNPLRAALSAYLSILGAIVTAYIAPEGSADATIRASLAGIAIDFKYLVINPTRPLWFWVFGLVMITALLWKTMSMIQEERMRGSVPS